jgi:hypothetical protein
LNDNDLPDGVYYYKIKYYLSDLYFEFVEGRITLFR